jgi:hypothetical protein
MLVFTQGLGRFAQREARLGRSPGMPENARSGSR